MAIDFKALNKKVDLKGLQKDIVAAKDNGGGSFKEVPLGNYEVSIEKLEIQISKKGDPMMCCWFNILDGEYKNSKIFYYQLITQGFQFHLVNEFLESLGTEAIVEFKDYEQYNDLMLDIHEEIKEQKLEYALEYGENKKGFKTYSIIDVFEN